MECKPEGYNVYVDFDKLSSAYYLHLPKYIKYMMDLYDILRMKYFLRMGLTESSLEYDETAFFLRGDGSVFKSLDLTRLSDELKIDVTSYTFRKIVSTWGQTNPDQNIRDAESVTLQHSSRVAKEAYLLNKQLQPQNFVQTYITQQRLFPSKLLEIVESAHVSVEATVKRNEKERQKKRYENLKSAKTSQKQLFLDSRPLGIRNQIRFEEREYFYSLLEEATGKNVMELARTMDWKGWRNFIVKTVCSNVQFGEEMRTLWIKMYKVKFLLKLICV